MSENSPLDDPKFRAYQAHLVKVGEELKRQLGMVPWHAERAARWGDAYWRDLAASQPNIIPGNPYGGS